MPTILVNPATQEVTAIEIEGDFLDELRRHIGCAQLTVIPVPAGRFCVWADNLGLLKPGRHFWRFGDSDFRFAGRCVLTGMAADGTPVPLPDAATPEVLLADIVWVPPDDLERIVERVVIVKDENGVPMPAIARDVIWKTAPPPEAAPAGPEVGLGWTVSERDNGSFRAVQYRLNGGDRLEPLAMITAASLKELRAMLPPGLDRREPGEDEPDSVVEHWLAPSPPLPS